ncbi:TonB-dependent receptor [Bacteroidia bacterium]|nr:TonB-dependent receptor [Bacteroidia bacterium]
MKHTLIILLFMTVMFPVQAQETKEIKGRVVEQSADGQKVGLPGASVQWLGTTEGTGTDEKGNFSIRWNAVGSLVVSFVGYRTDTVNVESYGRASLPESSQVGKTEKTENIEIVLMSGEMLDEVSVASRRLSTVLTTRKPIIEQVINSEELSKAACCNLGESFSTNASVDVSYADAVTGAKQVQLLGLTGKYVQMMTEGLPNFRGISSLYGLNYVPGTWMSSISISKGTASVIQGHEAIAGQMSVDYKKPRVSEKIFLNVYLNSEQAMEFNAHAGIILNDAWSTAILLHHDRMENEYSMHDNGFLDMPRQVQYNIMNRWEYKTDVWHLQFGGKALSEEKTGGQKEFRRGMEKGTGPGNYYGIGLNTGRYEGFMKIGNLMPDFEEATSMALLVNYTDHDQQSFFGARKYDVRQRTMYANYIFQSTFASNEDQQYSVGVSYNQDSYDEQFRDYLSDIVDVTPTLDMKREEKEAGAFFQYTGIFWEQLTAMAGLRYDYHNLYKGILTPRLHISYAPDDETIFKVSAGSGARTANVLSDNSFLLASGHSVFVNGKRLSDNPAELGKLDMEKAWNLGALFNRKFYIADRTLTLNLDYYHTNFSHQVVADYETNPKEINFYNLDGPSYSNSYQAEVQYELLPRLDVLTAIRYNDVKQTVGGILERQPLQSKYKGLVNLSYTTSSEKQWQFDFTTQFNGGGRLPGDEGNFAPYQIMNAQVSKFFKYWSIYGGCENIGDFTQSNPIRGYDDPWGTNFDASKVWGPLQGRKFYIGIRFGLT